MKKTGIPIVVVAGLLLVALGVYAAAGRTRSPSATNRNLISMDESAQAMQQAGSAMLSHGQAMLEEGTRNGDQTLIGQGNRWLTEGQDLVQGGQWMSLTPLSPSVLSSSPGESQMERYAQGMAHDPNKAGAVDLEALRWDGLAMRGEGQNMAEHARAMAKEADLMVAQHHMDDQTAGDLRRSVQGLRDAGDRLTNTGQTMTDYADRMERSLGK